jgi:uncharacterized protein YndB with AHSA1/START domain
MQATDLDRAVRHEVVVSGSVEALWDAWTTEEGIKSFFSPACNVDLRVDGPYEILFFPEAEPGKRGAEGVRVLAFQPQRMLAFTWNAPPRLPAVRSQWTHVVVRFQALGEQQTRVTLHHDGWGEGGEWDAAFDYFDDAWPNAILFRLKYRFEHGPVDWSNPPRNSNGTG